MSHIGSGDVVGDSPLMIAIARQNRNHFVPLLESVNVSGSGASEKPNPDVHDMDPDKTVKGDKEVASEAMSEGQPS
eukprot:7361116-Karenia_brevis.AAC.1